MRERRPPARGIREGSRMASVAGGSRAPKPRAQLLAFKLAQLLAFELAQQLAECEPVRESFRAVESAERKPEQRVERVAERESKRKSKRIAVGVRQLH